MENSPETSRSDRRRASIASRLIEEPARILAEARKRPIFALLAALAVLFSGLGLAVECSQVLRFRLADPWPAHEPALWTPESGHVERLRAGVRRLEACLAEKGLTGEPLAAAPDPALGHQGLYWTLWLISMLPEVETKPLGADGDPRPARLLVSGVERPGLGLVCVAEPLRLYRVGAGPGGAG